MGMLAARSVAYKILDVPVVRQISLVSLLYNVVQLANEFYVVWFLVVNGAPCHACTA